MEVRISKHFNFASGIHWENKFIISIFNFDASMLVYTNDSREQYVALERVNYIIRECLEDCVFVDINNTEAIKKYQDAGIKVCTTPGEPFEQIIAMLILNKCNSIMENKIFITDIDFEGLLSNGMSYQIVSEMAETMLPSKGWWYKNDTSITDRVKKDNIVKISENVSWEKLDLGWKEVDTKEVS